MCPADCPFLADRSAFPQLIPAFCRRHEVFLGGKAPLRCPECRGESLNAAAEGLALIDAYTAPDDAIADTKEAYRGLSAAFQRIFTDFVRRTGAQVFLTVGEPRTPAALIDKTLARWQERENQLNSPALQDWHEALETPFGSGQLRATKTLLTNLFMVLDNSEKEMLKNVLSNPQQVEAFLKQFEKQPQDRDLLRNTRALLYDYDKRRQDRREHEQMMRTAEIYRLHQRQRSGRPGRSR